MITGAGYDKAFFDPGMFLPGIPPARAKELYGSYDPERKFGLHCLVKVLLACYKSQ